MNRVLVVGGAGYVGGCITDTLMETGYKVTVYDSLLYEDQYLKRCNLIVGDVRDHRRLARIIRKYDIVVWLAAIVGDGACAVDPFLTESINAAPIMWLAQNYGGRIVFFSTCSVYGINNELIDETAQPHPLSVYAKTKLQAEQYLLADTRDVLIFRLGTLFGLGDQHARIRLDLVANILTMRATRGLPLTVFGGDQWRPLLHVKDVAGAVRFALDREHCGLFNLHDVNTTIKDLAGLIALHVPGTKIVHEAIKTEDERNYRVSSEKFRTLGWKPYYNLTHGIHEIRDAVREGRIKDTSNRLYSNAAFMREARIGDLVSEAAR